MRMQRLSVLLFLTWVCTFPALAAGPAPTYAANVPDGALRSDNREASVGPCGLLGSGGWSSITSDAPGVPCLQEIRAAGLRMRPRVVLIVRHAEVSTDGTGDPPLSPAGLQRAEALARIAASYSVEAAFVTPFRRTTRTAGPAADWLGLKAEAVPLSASGVPAHVADLAERVRQASGAAVLVVGHSNTVPALVFALTGQSVSPIAETEFDRLFVVRLPTDGAPTVEEVRY